MSNIRSGDWKGHGKKIAFGLTDLTAVILNNVCLNKHYLLH